MSRLGSITDTQGPNLSSGLLVFGAQHSQASNPPKISKLEKKSSRANRIMIAITSSSRNAHNDTCIFLDDTSAVDDAVHV